jgi:hypothetical protein
MLSCVKTEFDEPPSSSADPAISADQIISLEEVLSKRVTGDYVPLDLDKYVQGVIIADDKSGNFYKTLVIEDEKSDYGISILIDETEMHNTFPIGRRVFVYLKKLWISDYNGLPQLGFGPVVNGTRKEMASIPSTLMKETVLPGETGHDVTPAEVTISQLGSLRLNTLIKITGVQFKNEGDTYANAATQSSANRFLTTCANQEIILRSSGFADFAGTEVAKGKGSITAVYGIFGVDKQLLIRNLNDIDMKEARCGASNGDEPRLSIKDIKAIFKGTKTTAPKSYIQGVVISDITSKNLQSKNLVLQDGNEGIIVRFTADPSFKLGDEIKIITSDAEISEFNGGLQLNNIPNASASKIGNGTLPTPKEFTVKQIIDNLKTYESTLVKIKGATLDPGATKYDGNVTLQDGSGTLILRTTSTATFASDVPKKGIVDVTAIVSVFNTTTQVNIRTTDDIVGGSGPIFCPTLNLNVGDACNDNDTNTNNDIVTPNCECKGTPISSGGKITVADIRAKFTGTKTTAPDGYIEAVVISDLATGHITGNNIVVQEGDKGIVVRFTTPNTIPIGKKVKIITNGIELSEFNKVLQLTNVPAANASIVEEGTLPTPKEITIADLKLNTETFESTLVLIKEVTLSGQATYSGTVKMNDGTGQFDLFTRSAANFATEAIPSNAKNITGIVSEFTSGYQLNIRSLNDVK